MTCEDCDKEYGARDLKKLCCAVRFIEKSLRDDADRLLTQTAHAYGHKRSDLEAGVAHIRRERRKPSGEPAR